MEVEDEAIHGEHANVKEVVSDDVIGHRGEEDKRKMRPYNEGFKRAAEVETKGSGNLVGRSRGC
jgi:hypothetical protein